MTDVSRARRVDGPAPNDQPASIQQVQRLLGKVGHEVPITGRLDAETRAEIHRFQQEEGLRPTGRPDPRTVSALEGLADRSGCSGPDLSWSWRDGFPRVQGHLFECVEGRTRTVWLPGSVEVLRGGGAAASASVLQHERETRTEHARVRARASFVSAGAALGMESAPGGTRLRQELGVASAEMSLVVEHDDGNAVELAVGQSLGAGLCIGRTDADGDHDDELDLSVSLGNLRGSARVE